MKNELRKKYLSIRKQVHSFELDKLIFDRVINDKNVVDANELLIYVSYNNEVDTINIINYFLNKKKIAVPKIENDVINFYYINSLNDLEHGKYNILEPITGKIVNDFSACVCITPGICFDELGYRLGYGKGFYDKFFALNKNIYKIGLTYDELIISRLPISNNDILVNEIITPSMVKKL